ncbi:MAG: hypothetical protein GEV08_05650 [Acidimicrobiia bacterium]|nr:hypothetical protein [Acidimicrobiia bacterium]
MGQPVTVIEKQTSVPGVVQYETNRVLSGMGHDSFTPERPPLRDRPVDTLARRLLARGGVAAVHVNGNIITVRLATDDTSGIKAIVEDLYLYYPPGSEAPTFEAAPAE